MNGIGHQMILASAGSGKTYTLTNRFVRLLAMGAKPERIVALTFTRKAAGEFFDEILNKLASAATDSSTATKLAKTIGFPELGTANFLKMLRSVVDSMPRLRLGTFDGFFARIARSFPIELGLAGEFEVLQEHAARRERARVLGRLFQRAGELSDAQREFIEAFKRATFGAEEKRLGAMLDRFLDQHQEIFLAEPDGARWGNRDQIWPEGWAWAPGKPAELAAAAQALQQWVESAPIEEKARTRWRDFIQQTLDWSPGGDVPNAMEYVLKKALEAWPQLRKGDAILEFFRKDQSLDSAACAALIVLVRWVVGGELERRLETTRGIHAVLRGYESFYHDAVRRAGKLTFGDVQRLLMPREDGAGALTRSGTGEGRLFVDFRLDAEIDHWLLDEFQDTSFGQWSVLKNLIDEAVQDPTGTRSFFYVGDVKQAIFAWREGDPGLFREIFNGYNSGQSGAIEEAHLVESYRSGPPVIRMVNQVFGAAATLEDRFGGAAATAWNEEWKTHISAKPNLDGQVALLHAADETDRFRITLKLLLEIQPLMRGLSCAVLVKKNETAAALADFLRREGSLPAVAESDLHVCTDNPLGAALLALVKAAAHPGDKLAQEHLRMTPLWEVLATQKMTQPATLTRRLLSQLHADGFEHTLSTWVRLLWPKLEKEDAFTRERARQFIAAAGLFDATGSREVAEFIEFMQRHTVREMDPASVIRVMTVHKSKGLGFDLVILPDLEGKKLDSRRDGLAVERAKDRSIEWVLELPSRIFREQDPVLRKHVEAAEADACYENLSLLYVAMTRAKRAMYVVTEPPGSSKSNNFPRLLAETLGEDEKAIQVGTQEFPGAYREGNPIWFDPIKPSDSVTARALEIEPWNAQRGAKRSRLTARRPSDDHASEAKGEWLFTKRSEGRAIDLGRSVHALLAQVAWLEPNELKRLRETWIGGSEAEAIALAALKSPELAAIWAVRPNAEVWRERPFEIVLDGSWITGTFDRVIVEKDASGRALRADVFDFKTDVTDVGAGERYQAQLNWYRRAAAALAGLPLSKVACEVVLVRRGIRQLVPLREG